MHLPVFIWDMIINLALQGVSAEENSIMADSGQIDESIFSLTVQAYVINPDIRIDSWESFRDTDIRVEATLMEVDMYSFLNKKQCRSE